MDPVAHAIKKHQLAFYKPGAPRFLKLLVQESWYMCVLVCVHSQAIKSHSHEMKPE